MAAKLAGEGMMAPKGWPTEAQGHRGVSVTTQDPDDPWWRVGHVYPHADANGGDGTRVPARLL